MDNNKENFIVIVHRQFAGNNSPDRFEVVKQLTMAPPVKSLQECVLCVI